MATQPHDFGMAPPLRRALALIPSLPRPMLARFIACAIERLDEQDGDPDLEDATNAEDEGITWIAAHYCNDAAGCPISDPAEESDFGEDEHDAEVDTHSTMGANWHLDGPCRGLAINGGRD